MLPTCCYQQHSNWRVPRRSPGCGFAEHGERHEARDEARLAFRNHILLPYSLTFVMTSNTLTPVFSPYHHVLNTRPPPQHDREQAFFFLLPIRRILNFFPRTPSHR